jgi:hypothetical protein
VRFGAKYETLLLRRETRCCLITALLKGTRRVTRFKLQQLINRPPPPAKEGSEKRGVRVLLGIKMKQNNSAGVARLELLGAEKESSPGCAAGACANSGG